MRKIIWKYKRTIVILLGVALLVPIGITGLTAGITTGDDMRIATEISNMTGTKIERVLELKSLGRSWNQVLDMLKKDKDNQRLKDERNNNILQSGVGDETIEKLMDKGYSESEIMKAKMLVERVIFQLNEITHQTGDTTISQENDISSYISLSENIDTITAINLVLKLKNDFDSFENIMNEYLYSLQVELDLEDYIVDKERYLKEKEGKSKGLSHEKIITLTDIEDKMLQKIQSENRENLDSRNTTFDIDEEKESNIDESSLQIIPNPNVENVKPVNPTEEIMKEIEVINPNGD